MNLDALACAMDDVGDSLVAQTASACNAEDLGLIPGSGRSPGEGNGGFPGGASGKEPACQCRRHKRRGFNPWVRKIPWRWQPTPILLPRESHGHESLEGYSP